MKKLICFITVLLLCVNMAMPAYAAEDNFVPSITYKPNPEIIPVPGEDLQEYLGVIRDATGKILGYLEEGYLEITPIAHIWDEVNKVSEAVRQLLQSVYDGLNDGSIEIPYDKHEADLDPANMVIRDLFDARFTDKKYDEMLEPDGVVLELTFDLGVVADAEVYVQTYDEETGEWEPIVETVNNGDGTVTCTFEHLCAIAFSMPVNATTPPVEEPQAPNVLPWIIAFIVAAIAVIWTLFTKKKNKAKV